jgi:hypothetical protein
LRKAPAFFVIFLILLEVRKIVVFWYIHLKANYFLFREQKGHKKHFGLKHALQLVQAGLCKNEAQKQLFLQKRKINTQITDYQLLIS